MPVRPAAVAGSWYPGTAAVLAREVDRYVEQAVPDVPAGPVQAIVAPHAGLMYSGPVAAWAYRLASREPFDVAVLVGPSHFVAFDGVSLWPDGAFETPFGPVGVDAGCAAALVAASPVIQPLPAVHRREHSLEMQLPFLARLLPGVPIVPLLMGYQVPDTMRALGDALASVLEGRRALLVASTDLSHYHDARTAWRMDSQVIEIIRRFDAEALLDELGRQPEHACGGGPTVAVMRAAAALGARDAVILKYADSGDVSGDKDAVVGYLAAALGTFGGEPTAEGR
ncbi:MAG: AmmeMemoRadiSam system protein B [Acidobacteriota bacterium]|nr:AmmeMemoRadiSam system protein B [Acidobacteriota bacterium]